MLDFNKQASNLETSVRPTLWNDSETVEGRIIASD